MFLLKLKPSDKNSVIYFFFCYVLLLPLHKGFQATYRIFYKTYKNRKYLYLLFRYQATFVRRTFFVFRLAQ